MQALFELVDENDKVVFSAVSCLFVSFVLDVLYCCLFCIIWHINSIQVNPGIAQVPNKFCSGQSAAYIALYIIYEGIYSTHTYIYIYIYVHI